MQSTLLGAAAGGLLGNLLSKNNSNYTREGHYGKHYYYGGREFNNRKDYDAYRRVASEGRLKGNESRRYQEYRRYRAHPGNSDFGHQQWKNGNGHWKNGNGHWKHDNGRWDR